LRRLATALLLMMPLAGGAAADRAIVWQGAAIALVTEGEALAVSEAEIEAWVRKSAEAIGVYFGRFPTTRLRLVVNGVAGGGVKGGSTEPTDPVTISISLGSASRLDQLLAEDWVMVHEMIHGGLPWLPMNRSWFHEGVAVYVESIARVQAGHLSQERALRDFLRQMPHGVGGAGGFDGRRDWAKTYWGGALFCLLADIDIRRRTSNRKGLRDALRAISALGPYGTRGTFDEVLAAGDRATGTTVLRDLYTATAGAPIDIDLEGLWARLGVSLSGERVVLDDGAPDAAIRNAIFSAP